MNTQEDEAINTLLEIAEPDTGENEVNITATAPLSPSRKKPRININLRNIIVRNVTEKGMTVASCARVLGMDRSTVGKIVKAFLDRGEVTIRKNGHRGTILNDVQVDELCGMLDVDCTLTLSQVNLK